MIRYFENNLHKVHNVMNSEIGVTSATSREKMRTNNCGATYKNTL
jgi:hypothetical protein